MAKAKRVLSTPRRTALTLESVGLSAGHIIVQGIRLATGVQSLIRDVEAVLRIQRTNEKNVSPAGMVCRRSRRQEIASSHCAF
jgi:hypothetical protein